MSQKQLNYDDQMRRYYARVTKKARKLSNHQLTFAILSVHPWLRVDWQAMICNRCKERQAIVDWPDNFEQACTFRDLHGECLPARAGRGDLI